MIINLREMFKKKSKESEENTKKNFAIWELLKYSWKYSEGRKSQVYISYFLHVIKK